MLEDLRRGDLLRFNATITHLALSKRSSQGVALSKYHDTDESTVHHIHALDILKVEGGKNSSDEPITQHVHWDGRYSFNSEMQKKDFDQETASAANSQGSITGGG